MGFGLAIVNVFESIKEDTYIIIGEMYSTLSQYILLYFPYINKGLVNVITEEQNEIISGIIY
jgi:hypothetical protein